MVFSSIPFLCFFLPATFLLYYLIPGKRIKNIILILTSLLFYSVGEPKYILVMLGSIIANYIVGVLLGSSRINRKLVLLVGVAINVGVLVFFKYSGLGIALPVGISFYTFQAISYIVDVYRDSELSQKKFLNVVLYISFFPQLIAGPIIKYHDINEQIDSRDLSLDKVYSGVKRFIYGLSKKVLIANNMAIAVDLVFGKNISEVGIGAAWIAAFAYMFQIYFDFSGYSDMAIGLGEMFGFKFKENFNYPYSSNGIKDFWRRWHISLSTWFKEYVYFPLGGNRKGKLRTYVNKYIVFFLTGLWHGANITFVLWGLWHGTFSVLEEIKGFKRIFVEKKIIRKLYTWFVVMLGFVMFRAETVKDGISMIGQMFSINSFGISQSALFISCLTPLFIAALVMAFILSFPAFTYVRARALKNDSSARIFDAIEVLITLILLGICMISLASGSYNPFIYFRF